MNKNKEIFSVPEGYFEQLQSRLEAIPGEQREARMPAETATFWTKVKPYVALAASFLMIVFVGNHFLSRTMSQPSSEYTIDDWYYADLIPVTNPYAIYETAPDTYAVEVSSDDDILEYLISTGASLDYISQILNQ